MMNNYIIAAGRWLKSKFINAPNDWLEACIEWISEENGGQQQSQQKVNELVFEQWLLSDLHELGTQCLPGQLANTDKYLLNGSFALQIDSMVDISKSCYSQLQKIKGTENANVDVSADTHKPWEPKPNRMLMFKLTDGSINVQGMEYGPISCLNPQIQPGCKILVKGRILCRLGMLMLKGDNVSILGGEVDTLIEANPPENILKFILERNISNADKQYRQEFEGGPTISTKTDIKPVTQNSRRQNDRNSGVQPQVKKESSSQNNFDEFDEDLPLDELLDDMGDFTNNKSVSNTVNNNTANRFQSNTTGNSRTSTNNFPSTNNSSHIVQRNTACSSNIKRNADSLLPKEVNSRVKQEGPSFPQSCSTPSSLQTFRTSTVKSDDANEVCFMDDDFDDDFDMSATVFNNQRNSISTSNNSKKRQLVSPVELEKNNKKRSVMSSAIPEKCSESLLASTPHSEITERSRKRPLFTSPELTIKEKPCLSNFSPDISIDLDMNVNFDSPSLDRRNEQQMEESSSQEVDLNYDPWTYLSVVKKHLPTQQLMCLKVKAYISTLTGKLECPDGKRWCLPVKINDATASMDVDLSNKVLTELIGFSAQESQVLRKKAKTDGRIKDRLIQGMKNCQQKLVELLCIMEIEISPHIARPEVTSLVEITTADISVLADRLTKKFKK